MTWCYRVQKEGGTYFASAWIHDRKDLGSYERFGIGSGQGLTEWRAIKRARRAYLRRYPMPASEVFRQLGLVNE